MGMEPERAAIEFVDEPAYDGGLPLLSDLEATELLRRARRIAVVGASTLPWRPSHSVLGYLLAHGYECVPVNPNHHEVLGRVSYPSLEAAVEATGPFDIVDVFRRPEYTPDIARSAVNTGCRALWLQQGVISAEAVQIAHDGGLDVVMDRCTAVVHGHIRE